MKVAIFCVGNRMMLDDGVGPAVFDELQAYELPENVDLFDVDTMTMAYLNMLRDYDLLITVDSVDGTDEPVGTVFRYIPDEVALRPYGTHSLHELLLSDLFQAATLLGYEPEGVCLGMQVENPEPDRMTEGLTPTVQAKLGDLVDAVLAELVLRGIPVKIRATGELVQSGYHHRR